MWGLGWRIRSPGVVEGLGFRDEGFKGVCELWSKFLVSP